MNDDRTLERAARSFIEAGPTQAPEHAVDAALLRIETTQQERVLRIPWRFPNMTLPARLVALAVVGALVLAGVALLGGAGGKATTSAPPSDPAAIVASTAPSPSGPPSAEPTRTPNPQIDYADYPGRLLVQHLGNALDGSEADPADGHYDRRRLYVMDPDGSNISELLPGQPATGKNFADVSPDHTTVVFQDWSDAPKVYEVGLDGSGFRTLTDCDCIEGDPAYSPDGSSIAFNRLVGDVITLGIRDLATGAVTMLPETSGTWDQKSTGDMPEHPSWSPDGKTIVYAMMRHAADGGLVSSRLMSLDLESKAVTDLGVAPELRAGEPRYSPDGSLILFASRSAETSLGQAYGNVYTVHPDGTGLKQLTGAADSEPFDCGSGVTAAGSEHGTGASWTPDGLHILFMCNWIYLMDPDGNNVARWDARGPDISENDVGFGYTTYWIPDQP